MVHYISRRQNCPKLILSYFKHVRSPSQKLAMAYFLEVTDNYPHHDEKDFKCKLIEVFFL